jgi:D-alanyl-D-alanine carboxypeptidase
MSNKLFILFALLAFPNVGKAQHKARLDSLTFLEMSKRINSKGRNPVYNYQFYFNFKDQYIFDNAVGQNKKGSDEVPFQNNFKSASVSKTFIATMILQMEEEGKLKIENSISNYLDLSIIANLRLEKNKEITVLQLLNHTAGLADYILDDTRYLIGTRIHPGRENSPLAHLQRYEKHRLNTKSHEPGSTYYYSDTHYLLLGLIIEKLTGKSLQQNLSERIVEPIGLKNTYTDNWDSTYANMMHQYLHKFDITKKLHPSFEFGGGGFITSTADLSLFIKALFDNKLFADQKTLPKMIAYDYSKYGLGIMAREIPGNQIQQNRTDTLIAFGHIGYFGIEMYYIPSENITWIISQGQAYTNKNVGNFPIWLTVMRNCSGELE